MPCGTPSFGVFNKYMIAYRAEEFDSNTPRAHPWTGTTENKNLKYINFIEYPEKIRTSLEDWVTHSHEDFAEEFYQLLEWINGDESVFESNDCAYTSPHKNTDHQFKFKKRCQGRLMILFREHRVNCNDKAINWIFNRTMEELLDHDRDFRAAAIGFSFQDSVYMSLSPEDKKGGLGWQVNFTFFAYGSSDAIVNRNMLRAIKNLRSALESVNKRAIDGEMFESIS